MVRLVRSCSCGGRPGAIAIGDGARASSAQPPKTHPAPAGSCEDGGSHRCWLRPRSQHLVGGEAPGAPREARLGSSFRTARGSWAAAADLERLSDPVHASSVRGGKDAPSRAFAALPRQESSPVCASSTDSPHNALCQQGLRSKWGRRR